MTPDDKRRLAKIRERYTRYKGPCYVHDRERGDVECLLRLLDEAIAEQGAIYEAAGNHEKQAKEAEAERDAAMAALREWSDARKELVSGQTKSTARYVRAECEIESLLAAHSAATKQADPIEKEGSDG